MELAFTIAIVLTILVLAYLIIHYMNFVAEKNFDETTIEGMATGATGATGPAAPAIPNSASAAAAYAASIKNQSQLLKDQLLMSQYKADYDNIIINLEEYVNLLTVKSLLKTKQTGEPIGAMEIANFKQIKDALNDTMAYIDANANVKSTLGFGSS